jgi:hypothetical protein
MRARARQTVKKEKIKTKYQCALCSLCALRMREGGNGHTCDTCTGLKIKHEQEIRSHVKCMRKEHIGVCVPVDEEPYRVNLEETTPESIIGGTVCELYHVEIPSQKWYTAYMNDLALTDPDCAYNARAERIAARNDFRVDGGIYGPIVFTGPFQQTLLPSELELFLQ